LPLAGKDRYELCAGASRRRTATVRQKRCGHHIFFFLQFRLYLLSELSDIAINGGAALSVSQMAEVMLDLQRRGCHNVEPVTPTPQTPLIMEALLLARAQG